MLRAHAPAQPLGVQAVSAPGPAQPNTAAGRCCARSPCGERCGRGVGGARIALEIVGHHHQEALQGSGGEWSMQAVDAHRAATPPASWPGGVCQAYMQARQMGVVLVVVPSPRGDTTMASTASISRPTRHSPQGTRTTCRARAQRVCQHTSPASLSAHFRMPVVFQPKMSVMTTTAELGALPPGGLTTYASRPPGAGNCAGRVVVTAAAARRPPGGRGTAQARNPCGLGAWLGCVGACGLRCASQRRNEACVHADADAALRRLHGVSSVRAAPVATVDC